MKNVFKKTGAEKAKEQNVPVSLTNKPEPEAKVSAVKKSEKSESSELVIKEIMVQKGCTRDKAIEILKNPK